MIDVKMTGTKTGLNAGHTTATPFPRSPHSTPTPTPTPSPQNIKYATTHRSSPAPSPTRRRPTAWSRRCTSSAARGSPTTRRATRCASSSTPGVRPCGWSALVGFLERWAAPTPYDPPHNQQPTRKPAHNQPQITPTNLPKPNQPNPQKASTACSTAATGARSSSSTPTATRRSARCSRGSPRCRGRWCLSCGWRRLTRRRGRTPGGGWLRAGWGIWDIMGSTKGSCPLPSSQHHLSSQHTDRN
jgi:hypothetical protein